MAQATDERLKSKAWAARELALPGRVIQREWERRGWSVYRFGRFVRFRTCDVLRFKSEMARPDDQRDEATRLSLTLAEAEILGAGSETREPETGQDDDGRSEAQ